MRDKLEEFLTPAIQDGIIVSWYDRQIAPGEEFDGAINEQLEEADLILLLVSSAFMASKYIRCVELKRALALHEAGRAKVVPILLRPADWRRRLGKLQGLPRDGKAVSEYSNRDKAYLDIALEIRRLAEQTIGSSSLNDQTARFTLSFVSASRSFADL